ncbi:MAG: hypothetical protein ACRYGR_04140 [Janthinobacterium lividum]
MVILGKASFLISQEKALQIISRNQKGYLVRSNAWGNHPVFADGGIHFKSTTEFDNLNPSREFAVYSFYQLLLGQGAPASTFLVLNNIETDNPIEGRKKNRYVSQASATILGENFHDFFENHKKNSLSFLDDESVSGLILASFLTNPRDAKLDNFIVETDLTSVGKRKLISIDNDNNFFPVYNLDKGSLFVKVKNILYFEPFIKVHIAPNVKDKITTIKRDIFILHWLATLWDQDKKYQQLIKKGVISEKELRQQGISLFISLDILREIPKNLKRIQFWLKRGASLETIFRVLHPLTHARYQNLFIEKENARKALNVIYQENPSLEESLDLSEMLEDGRTIARAIKDEKSLIKNRSTENIFQNPLKEFAQEYFLHKFHLLYQVVQDKSFKDLLSNLKLILSSHKTKEYLEKNYLSSQSNSIIDLNDKFMSDKEIDILIEVLRQSFMPSSLILTNNLIKAQHVFPKLLKLFFESQQKDWEIDLRNNFIQIPDTPEDFEIFFKDFIVYHQKNQRGFLWLRGNPLSSSQLNHLDKIQIGNAIDAFIETGENRFLKKFDLTFTVRDHLENSYKRGELFKNCDMSKSSLKTIDLMALSAFFAHQQNNHQLDILNIGGNALTLKTNSSVEALVKLLKHQTNLTSLNLHESNFETEHVKEIIEHLHFLPYLNQLNLAGTYISSEHLKNLISILKNHPSITSLNLANNNFDDTQANLLCNFLCQHPNLDDVDLRWNAFSETAFKNFFNSLKENKRLTILRLDNNPLESPILEAISQKLSKNIIQRAKNNQESLDEEIKKLFYYKIPEIIQEEIISILRGEGSLYLEEVKMTPFMLKVLSQVLKENKVYVISIKDCKLTDQNFGFLIQNLKSRFPLKKLDLSDNKISTLEPFISLIQKEIPLTHLDLWGNSINETALKVFLKSLNSIFPKIRELDLSFNAIDYKNSDIEENIKILKKETSLVPVQILSRDEQEKIIYFENIPELHLQETFSTTQISVFKYLPVSFQYALIDSLDTLQQIKNFGSVSKYFKNLLNDYLKIKLPFFNKSQIIDYFYRRDQLSFEDRWLVKHENDILFNKEYYREDIDDVVKKSLAYLKSIVLKETLRHQFSEQNLKKAFFKTKNALKHRFFSSIFCRPFKGLTKAKLFFYASKIFSQEKEIFLKKSESNLTKLMRPENTKSYTCGEAYYFKWKYFLEEDQQKKAELLQKAADYDHAKAQFMIEKIKK